MTENGKNYPIKAMGFLMFGNLVMTFSKMSEVSSMISVNLCGLGGTAACLLKYVGYKLVQMKSMLENC